MSIIPLYNMIALPGARLWLRSGVYRELTGKAPVEGDKVTILMQKEDEGRKTLTADSFHSIGTVGVIRDVNEAGFVAVEIQNRINIEGVTVQADHSFSMTVTRRPDLEDLDQEDAGRRLKEVKERILAFSKDQQWEGWLRAFAAYWDSLWTVAAALSPWLPISNAERYELLAEDSQRVRFEKLERVLMEGLELADVKNAAQAAQQEDHE